MAATGVEITVHHAIGRRAEPTPSSATSATHGYRHLLHRGLGFVVQHDAQVVGRLEHQLNVAGRGDTPDMQSSGVIGLKQRVDHQRAAGNHFHAVVYGFGGGYVL